jgi:hypothetical protein
LARGQSFFTVAFRQLETFKYVIKLCLEFVHRFFRNLIRHVFIQTFGMRCGQFCL